MADNWNDNNWLIYPGSGPGMHVSGATCYRELRDYVGQKLETQIHTRAIQGKARDELLAMLMAGHTRSDNGIRCIANLLLERVNGGMWEQYIWLVKPNELRAYAGEQAADLGNVVDSALAMMGHSGKCSVDVAAGRVAVAFRGTVEKRNDPNSSWRTVRIPRADTRLSSVRNVVIDWITHEADEYRMLRNEAIRALQAGVVITKLQHAEGSEVSKIGLHTV